MAQFESEQPGDGGEESSAVDPSRQSSRQTDPKPRKPTTNQIVASWDVFIAHAGPDQAIAEELHDLLGPHCRAFLDSRCLRLGDEWDQEIARAQAKATITLVLISQKTERAYYQREEIAAALEMARNGTQQHRVIPIYLDHNVPIEGVPYGLRLKHGIRLDATTDLRLVADRVRRLLISAKTSFNTEEIDGTGTPLARQPTPRSDILEALRTPLEVSLALRSEGLISVSQHDDFVKDLLRKTLMPGRAK